MLCTLRKYFYVVFWGQTSGDTRRSFKSRAALQFFMRRRYGAGQWRQEGALLEVRQPFSGTWAAVGYISEIHDIEWQD